MQILITKEEAHQAILIIGYQLAAMRRARKKESLEKIALLKRLQIKLFRIIDEDEGWQPPD